MLQGSPSGSLFSPPHLPTKAPQVLRPCERDTQTGLNQDNVRQRATSRQHAIRLEESGGCSNCQ